MFLILQQLAFNVEYAKYMAFTFLPLRSWRLGVKLPFLTQSREVRKETAKKKEDQTHFVLDFFARETIIIGSWLGSSAG